MNRAISLTIVSAALLFSVPRTSAVTIDTVRIGNPGNAGDPQFLGPFGAVDHVYHIGTYEITNAQYAEFLNAKAASDPFTLYSSNMGSNPRGGITQNGTSGGFTYAVKPNMGNKPVNFVNYYDALRFTNWLHNGQSAGDTEAGAYTLLGGTPTPTNGATVARNSGAIWFVPSEDEWYKAAYHQPATDGGDIDNYWSRTTRTNSLPSLATANSVGDISNPGANVVNYDFGADWNGQDGNVTTVGSAGPASAGHYGTFDQGGNVAELIDAIFPAGQRGRRGGSWFDPSYTSANRDSTGPVAQGSNLGLRVATIPEPSTLALAGLGLVCLGALRWRRKC